MPAIYSMGVVPNTCCRSTRYSLVDSECRPRHDIRQLKK